MNPLWPVITPSIPSVKSFQMLNIPIQPLLAILSPILLQPKIRKNPKPQPVRVRHAVGTLGVSPPLPLLPTFSSQSRQDLLLLIDTIPQPTLQIPPPLISQPLPYPWHHGKRKPQRAHLHHPLVIIPRIPPILLPLGINPVSYPLHPVLCRMIPPPSRQQARKPPQRAAYALHFRGRLIKPHRGGARALDTGFQRREKWQQGVEEGGQQRLDGGAGGK